MPKVARSKRPNKTKEKKVMQEEYSYIVHYPDLQAGNPLVPEPFTSFLKAYRFAKTISKNPWGLSYLDLMQDGEPVHSLTFKHGVRYENNAVHPVKFHEQPY